MQLRNVALGITLADLKQGSEFLGAQQGLGIMDHETIRYAAWTFRAFAGGGLISAILRRQSASESWGPETNVPLTFVLYQPDTTPSQSASSVLTWRGKRFCMECKLSNGAFDFRSSAGENFRSFGEQPGSALPGEPGKIRKDGRHQVAMMGVVRSKPSGV